MCGATWISASSCLILVSSCLNPANSILGKMSVMSLNPASTWGKHVGGSPQSVLNLAAGEGGYAEQWRF